MATFTAAQFDQFLAAVLGRQQGMAATATSQGGSSRRPLHAKIFDRMEKFTGGEERWKDWSFDVKIAIKSQDPKMERAMRMVEKAVACQTGELSMEELRDKDDVGESGGHYAGIEDTGGELYQHLILMTDGEAKMIVKSVEDCDGYRAWARLYSKYNKRTLARLMRVHRECMYPERYETSAG